MIYMNLGLFLYKTKTFLTFDTWVFELLLIIFWVYTMCKSLHLYFICSFIQCPNFFGKTGL